MSGTTITGTYSSTQVFSSGAENPISVTGTISVASGSALLGFPGTDWTVTNSGLLESDDPSAAFGILLPGGGTVTNTSTSSYASAGTIVAGGTSGTAIQFGAAAYANALFNGGLISASADGVFGAFYVSNQLGGTISGDQVGVDLASGSVGSAVNAGLIEALGTYGTGIVVGSDGGSVTNQSTGTIAATGLGINMSAGGGMVGNQGLISAGNYGVDFATSVTNQSQGTIVATILGGKAGLNLSNGAVVNDGSIGGTSSGSAGILLSGGSVTNQAGGVIAGTDFGINMSGAAGTVVNAGFIGGAVDAVSFGAFANQLVIDPGAAFSGAVEGGVGSTSTLELASGGAGTLGGLGSQYLDFAQVIVDPGATWTLTGDNTLALGITLNANATLEVAGTVAANETIVFAGNGAALVVDATASMSGSVTGLANGEEIDLRGVDPASVSYAASQLDYTAPGGAASFPLSLAIPGSPQIISDDAGGTDVTAMCFCTGTCLATPGGEVPVERLAVGDTVLTASGATQRIVWIGVGRVLATRGRRSAATPVIVRKGALADNVPRRDLHVTKGHALWLDGVLIPVEFLVNHRSILWDDRAREVTLYHVELERHDVLLADGAPAESYRDDGNRWLFQNANSGWDLPPLLPFAPVLTGGAVVDAVWRRLLDRAGPRPGVPVTDDPDLHLRVDGERLDVAWRSGAVRAFRLRGRPDWVRIVSRSGVPQELGLARDQRPLGVALRRVVLRRGTRLVVMQADDPRLVHGFHGFEQDVGVRWTDGDALLPAALFRTLRGWAELELHLGGATQYLANPIGVAA